MLCLNTGSVKMKTIGKEFWFKALIVGFSEEFHQTVIVFLHQEH